MAQRASLLTGPFMGSRSHDARGTDHRQDGRGQGPSRAANSSWRLSRTRPLHEIAHRRRQFIVQLARTSDNLARDVCADVARPALGGVEGHYAQGMSILTG